MIRWFNPDERYVLERKTEGASGYDVAAAHSTPREVPAGGRWVFPTGLHLAVPVGLEAQLRSRSGLARDHGLVVAPGTIDSDYRGEVMVTLFNHGSVPYTVNPGQRIAQIVFAPVWPMFVQFIEKIMEADEKLHEVGSELSTAALMTVERVSSTEALGRTARGAAGHGSTGL